MGFSWKMDLGLLTGVVAKELVVSTLGVMYAPETADASKEVVSGTKSSDTALQAALVGSVSLPAAVAFMVFVLLYFPCIATFVAIKNETGKWSWAIAICAYTIAVAWIFAFLAFRLAMLLT